MRRSDVYECMNPKQIDQIRVRWMQIGMAIGVAATLLVTLVANR